MIVTCSVCGEVIAQTILGQIFGAAADESAHRLQRHHPDLAAGVLIVSPVLVALGIREVWKRLK